MNLWHAFILGIVEGITEFLPISSTAHLILTSHFLKLQKTEFLSTFEIAIQFGAILAVVVLYWRDLLIDRKIQARVLAAFLPTALFGFIFYKLIKKELFSNIEAVLAALFIGGILLIVFDLWHREDEYAVGDLSRISLGQAAAIGVFQSLAMIPGVSRAAATVLGGLLIGLKRKTIVEFSFILAVPTMLAATVLDIVKTGFSPTADQFLFLSVGFVTSFVVAVISIKFLLGFMRNHNFLPFGFYRVLAAAFFWKMLY